MPQILDKYLHPNGTEYAWIINPDGDFATVTQAELDDMIFAEQLEEAERAKAKQLEAVK